jgi:uncharacterized protein (DUF362 family)
MNNAVNITSAELPDRPPAESGACPGDDKPQSPSRTLTRRDLLVGIGGLFAAASAGKWIWTDFEHFRRAQVFIGHADSYQANLVDVIRRGLEELGLGRHAIRRKSILLKPNLVEPTVAAPHVNTHPALVRAVVEVFRQWDASEVFVAEGQGHCRDTTFVLEQSGLEQVLDDDKIAFVDLNYDDVFSATNRLGLTKLSKLYLPQSLRRADFIVSLPKMKTHHWAGVTLSMKNFFGVMPGVCYGWPKNVLHHAGISQSILDINATVRPHLAIVDGIVGMEGDGPIMGTPRPAKVVVMGANLPAVDATCARLMGFDPLRIPYLHAASGTLGPIYERHITQRGEPIASLAQTFSLPDHPHFKQFRS